MSESGEDAYAAAIGRNMWRLAKRRAISMIDPTGDAAKLTRAALGAAPENKARRLPRMSAEAGDAPVPAPTNLREFLRRLAAELGSDAPTGDAAKLTRAALGAAPENKARRLPRMSAEAGDAPVPAPTN